MIDSGRATESPAAGAEDHAKSVQCRRRAGSPAPQLSRAVKRRCVDMSDRPAGLGGRVLFECGRTARIGDVRLNLGEMPGVRSVG